MSATLERAREILDNINYLTLATVDAEGNPWNAPVFGVSDPDFNFYWGSHRDSQHSRNIRLNGKVYIVVYNSTVPAGTGEGVYVRAKASEVEDYNEILWIQSLMKAHHEGEYWDFDELQGEAPIRLYKATTQQVWMNDDGDVDGVYVDIRAELK